jgi:hypothetical protein
VITARALHDWGDIDMPICANLTPLRAHLQSVWFIFVCVRARVGYSALVRLLAPPELLQAVDVFDTAFKLAAKLAGRQAGSYKVRLVLAAFVARERD